MLQLRAKWEEKLKEELEVPPVEPPKKRFSPKCPEVPKLDSYKGKAPAWYWDLFPENPQKGTKSKIDHVKLKEMALECGYKDKKNLEKIVGWIRDGAKIGCTGKYRRPTIARNTKGCEQEGYKISDAVASWVKKGFVHGPVPMSEVPPEAKFSGLMTRPKPNGSCRIILNLSAPKKSAVNDGIDKHEFPASMSSTTAWLRVLKKAGRGCYILKTDWADAYKHCSVHPEDLDLQWFQWLGKAFVELCLIFGSVSSPGIFDQIAKLILFIVLRKSGFPAEMAIQHLDDICAAIARDQLHLLEAFDATFQEVAKALGVELAPRSDPEKSFAPTTVGTVLGVEYDTEAWTWGIPADKMARIRISLAAARDAETVRQDEMWSICGKIIHVKPLIPGGKFNVVHLLRANAHSKDPMAEVPVTDELRCQLSFWYNILPLCSNWVSIPDPDPVLAPWAIECWSDAAGGTTLNPWHGVGAVTSLWWAYMPWGHKINSGQDAGRGRRLDRVMSALELLGPLLAISAGYQWCRFVPVKVWVDNAAAVHIWRKGYSTSCPLSSTIVKAIHDIASAIGCRMEIVKITRCSTPGAEMADALSKGHFLRFWAVHKEAKEFEVPLDMAWVPKALTTWVLDPKEDSQLGDRILEELSMYTPVLGKSA